MKTKGILKPGALFGRLRVLVDEGCRKVRCLCTCGTIKTVKRASLYNAQVRSCGCLRNEEVRARKTKHGHCGSRTYTSWKGMLNRCNNPNDPKFHLYGDRGIMVCDRWRYDFKAFLADMGERPAATSLDRIDGTRGYSPDNCRWADIYTQNQNRYFPPRHQELSMLVEYDY